MAIIVVTGSTGSRRDPSASSSLVTVNDAPGCSASAVSAGLTMVGFQRGDDDDLAIARHLGIVSDATVRRSRFAAGEQRSTPSARRSPSVHDSRTLRRERQEPDSGCCPGDSGADAVWLLSPSAASILHGPLAAGVAVGQVLAKSASFSSQLDPLALIAPNQVGHLLNSYHDDATSQMQTTPINFQSLFNHLKHFKCGVTFFLNSLLESLL